MRQVADLRILTGGIGTRQRDPANKLNDVDRDEQEKACADEGETENRDRQDDLEKNPHEIDDDQNAHSPEREPHLSNALSC